ncbi:hypothetical protein [Salininema proteolyticum]|uniref:DUF3137 domain-containing protein n=1 Tax=Salininema proteolyticum TaxID=1607685 RepID=A0ABV8U0Z0_9ACTN
MDEIVGLAVGFLCLAAVVALFIAAFVKTRRQKRFNRRLLDQQEQALPRWAAQRGFTYAPRDDRVLGISSRPPLGAADFSTEKQADVHKLHWGQVSATFELLHRPEWIRGTHVMNAERGGRQKVVFQHHLRPVPMSDGSASGGDGLLDDLFHRLLGRRMDEKMQNAGESHRTVVAVRLPRPTPFLCVAAKPPGAKSVEGWGLRDMKLEHHAFNEKFVVHSQNDRFSMDVLHQRTLEWMLAQPPLQDASYLTRTGFVLDNGWCYLMAMNPLDPERLDGQIDLLDGFTGLIPAHVWRT